MTIDLDFQKRYATTVLELEQLNKDLNKVLHEVQQYCCEVSQWKPWKAVNSYFFWIKGQDQSSKHSLHVLIPLTSKFQKLVKNELRALFPVWITAVSTQLAPDQGMVPADHPTELRRRCEEEAQQMVQLSGSTKDGQQGLTNPGLTHLISRLTALLLQIKVGDV